MFPGREEGEAMDDPYLQGFPFGIRDVAELLHLKVRRQQADSMYTDCPFCGDRRGKMNINETDINPPAELGRLADASGDKRSTRI